jgi:hypothetical protein
LSENVGRGDEIAGLGVKYNNPALLSLGNWMPTFVGMTERGIYKQALTSFSASEPLSFN